MGGGPISSQSPFENLNRICGEEKERTTQQNFDIVRGFRHVLLDLPLRDESSTPVPSRRRVVQHVIHFESPGERFSQRVQLLLEQDILGADIGVDQAEFGLVCGVLQDSANDLEHGRDSGAACYHTQLARETRAVYELAFGAFDVNIVTDFEQAHVFRDVAFLIRLDHACVSRGE
jgi:hypothetical protein